MCVYIPAPAGATRSIPYPEDVMSRSFIHLRWALLGVSYAVVFGFGATQAFTGPPTSPAVRGPFCPIGTAWCASLRLCVDPETCP